MNFPWFKRLGLFYAPKSIIAWIILIGGIGYAVYSFVEIDGASHSVSDTLMNFVFRLILIGAMYTLVAFITSYQSTNKH